MPKRREKLGRVGSYWLSQDHRSRMWCRTWYDPRTRQTCRSSLGEEDFQQALLKLAEWYSAQGRGPQAQADEVPIDRCLTRYYLQHAQNLPSASSAKAECRYWQEHFAGQNVSDLTIERQENFIASLREGGLSDGYISRILSTGRAAVNRMHKRGELATAPFIMDVMTTEDRAQTEPLGRPLTIEEMAALIDHAKSRHVLMWLLLSINTLARPGAVLELTTPQIDWRGKLIPLNPPGRRQTKKHRPVVPMTSAILPWLRSHAKAEQDRLAKAEKRYGVGSPQSRKICPYLVNYHGQPVSEIKTAFRALRSAAGLDAGVRPYSIRHTMGRELRARRVPSDQISIMLGHMPVNVKRTDLVYSPYDPDYCRAATDAIDDYMVELQRHCRTAIVGARIAVASEFRGSRRRMGQLTP